MAVHSDQIEGRGEGEADPNKGDRPKESVSCDPWKGASASTSASSTSGFDDNFQPNSSPSECQKLPDSEQYLAALEARSDN